MNRAVDFTTQQPYNGKKILRHFAEDNMANPLRIGIIGTSFVSDWICGAAKATGTIEFLVGNSIIHFLAVVLLSVAFSLLIAMLAAFQPGKRFQQGRAWIELWPAYP